MMDKKQFEGKRIILALPNHFQLPQRFKEALEALGFEVVLLVSANNKSIPLKDTIIHVFKKVLLHDRTYKQITKNKMDCPRHLETLNNIEWADYALFIRPDLFDKKVVKLAKEKAKRTIAYQWDALKRFPLVEEYIGLFDKFYVFDKKDLNLHEHLYHTDNFYFDDLLPAKPTIPGSVFFLGTYTKQRLAQLNDLAVRVEKCGLQPNFHLFSMKKRNTAEGVTMLYKNLSFKECVLKVQQAEYVIDLQAYEQGGLSFRTFESIGYDKKLITNNPTVRDYDFYNPNNIFVLTNDNMSELDDFTKKPYQPLDKEIKEKYSFTLWLTKLLK